VPGIPDQIVSAIIPTLHNRAEQTVTDRSKGKPSTAAYEDAIEAYKRRTRPQVSVLNRLAMCLAHLGRIVEAEEMAQRILALSAAFRIATLRRGGYSGKNNGHCAMACCLQGQ